jgi:multidrug efflux pump subunit AcrA (membrane-fusion protein)
MKRSWKDKNHMLIVLVLFLIAACSKSNDHAEHDNFTCPMHPTVVSDKPGSCPVCGMDLVRKARPGEELKISEGLVNALKAPDQSVVSSIKTTKPSFMSIPLSVKALGIITYDARNVYTVSARVGGRLEKSYLKYEFQPVIKGQKIAEIYSPELSTAQRELLYVLKNDSQNHMLVEAAKSKLIRLGLSTTQVEDLIKRQRVGDTFSIYSPYDGYVVGGGPTAAIVANSGKTDMTSESASLDGSPLGKLPLREGSYISEGQTLVKIVNTRAIRIELNVDQRQIGTVTVGDEVEIDFGNGTKEMVSVDFVQPFFDKEQSFLKLRLYAKKIEGLPIGQLVEANLKLKSTESLWLPKQSVIDLGNNKVVFVKDRETFKPKKIVTGISTGEFIEVKSGLATADEIASNAQYLVDSESFIKTAN